MTYEAIFDSINLYCWLLLTDDTPIKNSKTISSIRERLNKLFLCNTSKLFITQRSEWFFRKIRKQKTKMTFVCCLDYQAELFSSVVLRKRKFQ